MPPDRCRQGGFFPAVRDGREGIADLRLPTELAGRRRNYTISGMSAERCRIELLPDSVINQIAAGEVIERPASVVKELIENSLDAGARQIDVECEQGGGHLIRVRDDGAGIPPQELALALSRHATSKLRVLSDLTSLSTLGFRGEALPSIGAVARLTLMSCAEDSQGAWSVSMEGNAHVDGSRPAAHTRGTTVEVRDLFFNVPARRRFLKSDRTEFLHIHDALRRTALVAFSTGIHLSHNGQRLLALRPAVTASEQAQRVEKICGTGFARVMRGVEATTEDMRVWGWIAPPEATRNQSDLQLWFVNGRPVRDSRLQHATRLAYEDALPPGRHPAYVLYLEMDATRVDVNVHPAKSEVRFVDARRVHDFVLSALRHALRSPVTVRVAEFPQPSASVEEQRSQYLATPPGASATRSSTAPMASDHDQGWAGEPLTLLGDQLLLARAGDALLIVDAMRARAALFKQALGTQAHSGGVRSQPLLFPAAVDLDPGRWQAAVAHADVLAANGFDIEPAGPQSLLIRTVPSILREVPPPALVEPVLALLLQQQARSAVDHESLRNTLAHAAAQALLPRTREAMSQLLRELERTFEYAELANSRIVRRTEIEELRRYLVL